MNAEITELFNQLLTIGVKLVIAIATVWLAKVGIPWLKSKKIYSIIRIFVQAAEKKADAGSIDKSYKKTFVINLLSAIGIHVTDTVDAMIESAVEELDESAAKILTQIAGDEDSGQ